MNFFSNIFTPKKGPPTDTLNDYTYQFNVNQDDESPKKKSRIQREEYTPNTDEIFERAKQGNKYSSANLNMGVDLARRGVLPDTPENQYIFQEMNRIDNLRNNRAQQDYLAGEQQRQAELERLQKEHAENMAERRRQEEMLKQQQEQEQQQQQQQQEQEQQQQQEFERQQEEERQKQQQEILAQRERMRQQYEEQERIWKEQRDKMFQEHQRQTQAEQERIRQEEQQRQQKQQRQEQQRQQEEQQRQQEEQQRQQEEQRQRQQEQEQRQRQQEEQRQQVPQTESQIPKPVLPEGVIDMDLCRAYNFEVPRKKEDCNRRTYKKLSVKFHPDKNTGCIELAKAKFLKLKDICYQNEEFKEGSYNGGSKKKTKKYFKKKTHFKITKKAKKSKRVKKNKTIKHVKKNKSRQRK